MAFEVLDEHEQGELVQKWLRENVLTILVGVGLGLVLIFGWQQWRSHRARHDLEAATQYEVLSTDAEKKDYDAVKQIAAKLKTDYSDTPYAVMPFLFGEVGRALAFALPGNPVSGIAIFLTLLKPALVALAGAKDRQTMLRARLALPIDKRHSRAEFQRARLA